MRRDRARRPALSSSRPRSRYRATTTRTALRIIEGFNFTPAIGGSPFRLEGRLAEARVEDDDPVIAFVHLTSPRLDFLDRGKARVALPLAVAGQIVGPRQGRHREVDEAEDGRDARRAGARRGAWTRCAGATGR